jgi:NagD protein
MPVLYANDQLSVTGFSSMTRIELSAYPDRQTLLERVGKIRHVALDMDGTIYRGGTLFPYTVPFLGRLKEMGIGYSFLTNNPSKSVADYLKHMQEMGLPATPEELYTSAQATITYLKAHHPRATRLFILGTPSMTGEFEKAGYASTADDPSDEPDAVVVGFDMTLAYPRLCRAAWWIHCGKPYVATNPDWVCPTDQPTILVDCGSICAMLEKATGRKPGATLGKPQPEMLDGILDAHRLHPFEVAMVGDRIYTDMMMAHKANAFGVLVLSGEATLADAQDADPRPDVALQSIEQLGELIAEARL